MAYFYQAERLKSARPCRVHLLTILGIQMSQWQLLEEDQWPTKWNSDRPPSPKTQTYGQA